MVKVPYNIPEDVNTITYMMIDIMRVDLEKIFEYLCIRMNLTNYPLKLDLSIPYHPAAFGMFRAYNMTVNIFIGSIIYCLERSGISVYSKEGVGALGNTVYNVMIHELSHAGQCILYETKRGIKELPIKTIEAQNFKQCYDTWYPTLKHDLDKLFGINPLDVPFYWNQNGKDLDRNYMGCSPVMQMVYLLGLLNNGSYKPIYDDLFKYRLVDLTIITTDLYNNIIDIDYVGIIKNGYTVPKEAFEKIISFYESRRINKRSEEVVYYSSVSDEASFCRVRLFSRIGYYSPFVFCDKKDKKRNNAMIKLANHDQSEVSLFDKSESMLSYVDDYVVKNYGAYTIKEEGK